MSVLSFPRIHFKGVYSWDPGLTNNFTQLYDSVNARIVLPNGVSYDSLIDFILNNNLGSWNYYGTHDCNFVSARTSITGGVSAAGMTLDSNDPIVGKSVRLAGKLVDLDTAANWNSQIFFDSFRFGDSSIGLRATRRHRMHSRWIGPRATFQLPIAGGFGVVWQSVFAKQDVTFFGTGQSPLLAALASAVQDTDVAGLMLRFSTFRTLYFQGDGSQDVDHPPGTIDAMVDDLHQRYRNGENFSNPAFSFTVGTVGLWHEGEIPSVPEGRYLATDQLVTIPSVGGFPLGPCVAEINTAEKRIAIDFCQTIPEVDFGRTKADLGTLTLAVEHNGMITDVAPIPYGSYDQVAYESRAGIVDLDIQAHKDPQVFEKLASGQLLLLVSENEQAMTALREQDLTVQASLRDVYVDEGQNRTVKLTVRDKGQLASVGTKIRVVRYDRSRNIIPGTLQPSEILLVEAPGLAELNLNSDAPGFINLQFYPFRQNDPVPSPGPVLNITTGFFLSVRFLPFDDDLELNTGDQQLSFKFVYENVLRPYHLLNPVMAREGIDLPLDDKTKMTRVPTVIIIRSLIAAGQFESARYMPVTRDLSAGKRRLLERFCDLVENGALPPDDSDAGDELLALFDPTLRLKREA